MANFLDDLPQNVKKIAERGNLTSPEKVITTSKAKLLVLGCSEHDIKVLKEAAAKIIAAETVTVDNLLKSPRAEKWARISYGCSAIDACSGGGVVTRGITEICGASGVGKTQLLLQLSLMVQLPKELGGLSKGVAFICTEDVFPTKRLFQLSKVFEERFPDQRLSFLQNVHIVNVYERDELLKCVEVRLKSLLSSVAIGLIIVDSVAAIFRLRTDYIQRAQDMRKLANALRKYADKYNCGVVCVNQVSNADETPCLGLAWAHLGRTRIKISKIPKQITVRQKGILRKDLLTARKFEVMHSPETPNDFAEFIITSNGIVDVPTSF